MPAVNPDNWWKCSECGYTFQAAPPPPEQCPSCKEKCAFIDVTRYAPDCGPGTPYSQLMHTPTVGRVEN